MPDQTAARPRPGQRGPHPGGRGTRRDLVTTARLREFFSPRSIAMVGASENSGWARCIVGSCATIGFSGSLTPVHPRAKAAFGLPAVPSLRDLPEPPDLVFLLTPVPAVEGVLDDMGAVGSRNAVVLASGYRETGAEGRALEAAMVARAASHGVVMLGPNCMGFINARAGSAPYALNMPRVSAGPVGVALQSGGLASFVMNFARAHGIGLSTLASMGNESMIKTVDVLDYLIEDEGTRVICLFLEEISDPSGFARAAASADRAGKPVVVLKVGSSEVGQAAALAHTGSVAGNDAVVEAAFRQLNIIRVTNLEEMLSTAALLAYNRWPAGRRMGVLSGSGGACDIVADLASAEGIEIPEFARETSDSIGKYLPPFLAARNPLDVGAYDLANVSSRSDNLKTIDHALDAAVEDPNLDLVLFMGSLASDAPPPDEAGAAAAASRLSWLAQRIARARIPVIPVGSTCLDASAYSQGLLAPYGLNVLGGVTLGVRAVGHALRWLDNRGRVQPFGVTGQAAVLTPVMPSWSEAAARELVKSAGVPVVPGSLARSADEAAEAARALGLPVALKICSAQITHKSDIGGVALGLDSDAEVRGAFAKVLAAGAAVPGAEVDGVLVTPMRSQGAELLVGATVDPTFGPVLAVGLGGIWVEVLQDTSLRVLPVSPAEARRMLGELRGLPLLTGTRGAEPADLDAVAEVISRIGQAALSLGDALGALEVNPLWVRGNQVEALDVLVVTERPGTAGRTAR